MYVLVLQRPTGPMVSFPLHEGRNLIGSAPECDLAFYREELDPHLFAIELDGNDARLIALGPTRVSVNRRAVLRGTERSLRDGDRITYRDRTLRLSLRAHLSDPSHELYDDDTTEECPTDQLPLDHPARSQRNVAQPERVADHGNRRKTHRRRRKHRRQK